MATAEQIKTLIQSHYNENSERFNTMVLQLAAHEATQGHGALARDLRKYIDDSKKIQKKVIPFNREFSDLIIVTESNHKLSELVVTNDIKHRIERVIKEYRQQDKLRKHGLNNRRKLLFEGPPGTGKTMTASILAGEINLPLCTILMDKMVTKYMGETSSKLRQIFDTISEVPGVYLFDEFDAIGTERGLDNDVGEMRRVLNAFLQFIEQDNSNSFIVAATNNHSMLDQALFRRFDDVIHYSLPNDNERERLIRNRLSNFARTDFNYKDAINKSKTLSHSEISNACDDSIKDAILNDKLFVDEQNLTVMINEKISAYKHGEV